MNKLKITDKSVEQIIPYKDNAKIHTEEQVEQIIKSIQKFGNCDPIAIDENNVIIEGHGRFEALKRLGQDKIPVIVISHLTENQKRAYRILHNKINMNTGFDEELLRAELEKITLEDFDLADFDLELDDSDSNYSFIDELLDSKGLKGGAKNSDVQQNFAIAFVFPIEHKELMKKYLKTHTKDSVSDEIIKMAQEACKNG
jgi:ParB-like chromosome segregation protein Spo0J